MYQQHSIICKNDKKLTLRRFWMPFPLQRAPALMGLAFRLPIAVPLHKQKTTSKTTYTTKMHNIMWHTENEGHIVCYLMVLRLNKQQLAPYNIKSRTSST